MRRFLLRAACALVLAACDGPAPTADAGTDAGAPVWDPACDNVDPTHCLLPWPSDHFRRDGRVALPASGMPVSAAGDAVDPAPFAREGFSLHPAIMTVITPAPDESSLFGENAIEASLGPDATAVIVDVATGQRVPCFAELDRWPDADPERVPLYVRPAVRLAPGTRYAVALRGLVAGGRPIEPSPFFRALRDGTPLEGSDVEARRAEYEEIFAALERAGVPRGELVVAWAFTTAPEASITRDLLAMRDGMLELPPGACRVERVEDARAGDELPPELWRRVHGTIEVPLYLRGTGAALEDSWIVRDAEGRPVRGETIEVPFLAIVPESLRARVEAGGEPGRAIVYGHGILGTRAEANSRWMHGQAAELEAAVFATDWWGMSEPDLGRIGLALTGDFGTFAATTERLHQGVLDVLALVRAVRETCAVLPELSVPLADGTSAPAYDPTQVHYYGNSLGGILGAVVAGVAPDLERAVLGVAGGGWPMLVKRSDAWRGFNALLMGTYRDPVERALLVAMSGLLWAPVDGITYAPHWLDDPLPGAIERRVLMQIGVGDVAVSNAAAHVLARSAGLPLTVPSVEEPFGLETTEGPAPSGLTIYKLEGVEPLPPG
ncbi:MAG TPA: hypothetical protein VIL20_10310, partial [Sandaracinaceae bacterium]